MIEVPSWKLWTRSRRRRSESPLLRYGLAVLLPVVAAGVVHVRGALAEAPFFVFLGAVVLSAVNGGLAPAFLSTALSLVLLCTRLVAPVGALNYDATPAGMERMIGFVLMALLASSFVAALRREREELFDSEECHRVLAETASDTIIVIDDHGQILYVNPVCERLFGTKAEQLLGHNLNQLLPGNLYQTQLSELKHRLDTRRKPVAVQLPGLHQNGAPLVVEMTLGASCHRGKSMFTAILRDVTAPARIDAG